MRITSVHNPRVAGVCGLRKHRTRDQTGLFIAEGRREVLRAIAAGLVVREVWWCPALIDEDDADLRTVRKNASQADWYEAGEPAFRKMAYLPEPHGLLAVVEQPRWSLDQLFDRPEASGEPQRPRLDAPLLLIAVGLSKPGNLGAMARTAAAAGATALLIGDGVVDAFNPNAIRASTGAVFSLPVIGADRPTIVHALRQQGIELIAAALDGQDVYEAPTLSGPLALAIGAEDRGLPPQWLAAATRRVRVPMPGVEAGSDGVDSLNAAAASAVLLFEAVRQRRVAARAAGSP